MKQGQRVAGLAFTALCVALLCPGMAQASEKLARKSDCLGCHSVVNKLVGPAYKDVATKYAGQRDAAEQLQASVRNGSSGKWGDVPMPPHPKLSATDLNKLVNWVLSLK